MDWLLLSAVQLEAVGEFIAFLVVTDSVLTAIAVGYCCWTLWAIAVLMAIAVGRMLSVPKAGAVGRKDTDILAAGSGSCRPVDSCVVLWLVEWLMIMNLCFELVAVAVGLAAVAVDFLNSLMIVCYSRPSTLDR